MKCLQTNLGRGKTAHDIALAVALKNEVDLIIISEPNPKISLRSNCIFDEDKLVAVQVLNKNVGIKKHEIGKGFVKLSFEKWHLYCCYISPNIDQSTYQANVDLIMNDARDTAEEYIIVGDLNSKSPMWGSPISDKRGKYLEEWISETNLTIQNTGEHTFERGDSRSHIDVTFATQKIAKRIQSWQILEGEFHTYHRHILFNIIDQETREYRNKKHITFLDKETLTKSAEARIKVSYDNIEDLSEDIKRLVKESTRRVEIGKNSTPYWWDDSIDIKQKECTKTRRVMTRLNKKYGRDDPRSIEGKTKYDTARKDVRNTINRIKRAQWKKLCIDLEEDIWGKGYQIVLKQLGKLTQPYYPQAEQKIEWCKQLFPASEEKICRKKSLREEEIDPFTIEELDEVVKVIKLKKAPGPDKIPPEAIKIIATMAPHTILDAFNKLMKKQDFPEMWKEALVVLIWKGGEMFTASSYRTICLLNILGKVYEGLIKNRLEKEIERNGGFSTEQYGFCKGKSTIQAVERVVEIVKNSKKKFVMMIALDIQNAFNSAQWNKIIDKLESKGISRYLINVIDSYLSHRVIKLGKEHLSVTVGVPQGSVLGPTLWNVLYDDVLRVKLTEDVTSIAFADDLVMVVEASDVEELTDRANESIRRIERWIKKHALKLAPHKTEMMILKGSRNKDQIKIRISDIEVGHSTRIKYLGIVLDEALSCRAHVSYVIQKAQKRLSALTRIMPNVGGPGSAKRTVLYGVVQSVLLYGAPVWSCVTQKSKYRAQMLGIQRKVLLRVISGYRTISAVATQAIAGIPPLTHLIDERNRLYLRENNRLEAIKREERDTTLRMWQEDWNLRGETGNWTKTLITDLKAWVECPHRRTSYYLTQFLSGHGRFGTYTKKMKITSTDDCFYCGTTDTPEHTVFHCQRWNTERQNMINNIGKEIEVNTVIQMMIENKDHWQCIEKYIQKIISTKEIEDRERTNLNN